MPALAPAGAVRLSIWAAGAHCEPVDAEDLASAGDEAAAGYARTMIGYLTGRRCVLCGAYAVASLVAVPHAVPPGAATLTPYWADLCAEHFRALALEVAGLLGRRRRREDDQGLPRPHVDRDGHGPVMRGARHDHRDLRPRPGPGRSTPRRPLAGRDREGDGGRNRDSGRGGEDQHDRAPPWPGRCPVPAWPGGSHRPIVTAPAGKPQRNGASAA